ncbi:MAG: hypothetical protein HC869_15575 [Rhodospirillales bacterium]|nr:hypothetical protein [Rhodospirillales bacterium]
MELAGLGELVQSTVTTMSAQPATKAADHDCSRNVTTGRKSSGDPTTGTAVVHLPAIGPSFSASTATGGPLRTVFGLAAAGKFPPYRVGDVIVAPEVRLEGHESVILGDWLVDSASPQGVLGLDLLARYALLFDEAAGLLHFYAADAELNYPEDWGEIRLIPDDFGIAAGSLYTLVAYVERVRIPFMLDLGASGTIINRPAVERIASSYFRLNFGLHPTRLRDRITDALGKTEASRAYSVQRLRAGDVVWRSVVLYGHDGSIFEEIGAGDEAFGLFGSDMFRDRSFMIDFPRSRILVSKPSRTD